LCVLGITVAEFSKNIGDNIAQGIYFFLCWLSFSITSSPPIPFQGQHAKAELSETKQLLTVLIRLLVWRLIQNAPIKRKRNGISYSGFIRKNTPRKSA
jgi:hypothetical protein